MEARAPRSWHATQADAKKARYGVTGLSIEDLMFVS